MKISFHTIFAMSVMLIGFSSYADHSGPNYPPPDQQQQQQQLPAQPAQPPPGYFGPNQAGLYGYYDQSCLPPFDPNLFYRCPSPDVFACAPMPGGLYGYVYPYPNIAVPVNTVLVQRWWGYWGPQVAPIYQNFYNGPYFPPFRQVVNPMGFMPPPIGMMPPMGFAPGGYIRPGFGFYRGFRR